MSLSNLFHEVIDLISSDSEREPVGAMAIPARPDVAQPPPVPTASADAPATAPAPVSPRGLRSLGNSPVDARHAASPQSARNRVSNGSAPTTDSSITYTEETPTKTRQASTLSFSREGSNIGSVLSRPSDKATHSSPLFTTPPKSHSSRHGQTPKNQTPKNQTPRKLDWSTGKIETSLRKYATEIPKDHAKLLRFTLESTFKPKAAPRHNLSSIDDFAGLKLDPAGPDAPRDKLMKIKLKQHGREHQRNRGDQRQALYPVVCIKSNSRPVPKYRFHHVEIAKNILSPNTPLKFIPHLRDLEEGDSANMQKFNQWIEELEFMDQKSGFNTASRNSKGEKTRVLERAMVLSLYLERWIQRLGIDNCSKATLIRHMASQSENDDAITPQQKNHLLNSYNEDVGSPRAVKVARMFTDAFNRVFGKNGVKLDDVLMLDESVETVVDTKKLTKEGFSSQKAGDEQNVEQVEQYLASYTVLGCMICYAHSCEHGEFDADNIRRYFSIDTSVNGKLGKLIERRRIAAAKAKTDGSSALSMSQPCKNKCYRNYDIGNEGYVTRDWTEEETNLLRTMFLVLCDNNEVRPQCTTAVFLGRYCWEVYRKLKQLNLTPPEVTIPDEASVKAPRPIAWYDRHRKALQGDWQDHTYTHEHAVREMRDPCLHDGPCSVANGCPCVAAKVMCERFCRCTAETCAHKFTGCACHSSGKTCYARQKEGKPCICVQLNRECDPVLCGSCGARERADPQNAHDEHLHATGCQNVALQRGVCKQTLIGKSQLEACGYGLFTAEDIAADEFVIEYVGELITHDEGVRREARRGDVFDEESNSSYLFTLLEQDGIWVDAAMYGNLSRYINHAGEHDRRACNITPKILYVNGEFRIRFAAIRDIKAGEELFFNYGENFPNLTKKLLEDKVDDASVVEPGGEGGAGAGGGGGGSGAAAVQQTKKRGGRPRGGGGAARKGGAAGGEAAAAARRKQNGARKVAPPASRVVDDDDLDDDGDLDMFGGEDYAPAATTSRGAGRGGARGRFGGGAGVAGRKRKRHHGFDDDDENDDEEEDEYRPGVKESEEDSDFRGGWRGRGGGGGGGGGRRGGFGAKRTRGGLRDEQRFVGGGDDDSVLGSEEDVSAAAAQVQVTPTRSGRGIRGGRRARSGSEIEDSMDVDTASFQSNNGGGGGGVFDEEDEDDDSVLDSATRRRKRQKPARFRGEE